MLLPYSFKYSAHFFNVVPENFNKSFTNKIIVKLRCSLFSVSAQFSIKQISLAYGPLQNQRKINRSENFFLAAGGTAFAGNVHTWPIKISKYESASASFLSKSSVLTKTSLYDLSLNRKSKIEAKFLPSNVFAVRLESLTKQTNDYCQIRMPNKNDGNLTTRFHTRLIYFIALSHTASSTVSKSSEKSTQILPPVVNFAFLSTH